MEPLISVIVPVYNVEKYLDACIGSIVDQTYRNLQILLIDDGSRDASGSICDRWAQRDGRIQVIHQENAGVSAARNAGLDRMTGDYLLFVDGDDTLAPETIETALKGFVSDEIDVTLYGVAKVWIEEERRQELPMETGIYSRDEMLYGILKDYASFGAGFPVNKVWRVRTFGGAAGIPRFDADLYFFEDLEWVVRMLLRISKANLLPVHCYNYHIHAGSATHNPGTQERRETGYHQSIWKILQSLQQVPPVLHWFSNRYYPEVVNGVINAWQNRRPALQKKLLNKLAEIEQELLRSDSVSGKIKFRCVVLRTLHRLGLL